MSPKSVVTLTAVMVMVLTACGGSSPDGGGVPGGTSDDSELVIGITQEPDTLDVAVSGLAATGMLAYALFDPLVWRYAGEDGFEPGLATDLEVNDEATEFTFTLREDVTFSDGEPLNAEALQATFDYIVDPDSNARNMAGYLEGYVETRVDDEYVATVVFEESNMSFLDISFHHGFAPQSPAALADADDAYGRNPVGTGPYVVDNYSSGDSITLTLREDYNWGPERVADAPQFETITFQILEDAGSQRNALTTGEIDIANGLTPQDLEAVDDQGYTVVSQLLPALPYGYMLNTNLAPSDELQVRQAVMHAVDRESIVDTVRGNLFTVSEHLYTSAMAGVEGGDFPYEYDVAQAEALLEEGGWELNDNGQRERDGEVLSLHMLNNSTDQNGFDQMTQLIQSQLGEIGIGVTISAEASPGVYDTYHTDVSNTADMFFSLPSPILLQSTFSCDAYYNFTGVCSDELDQLVVQANSTVDDQERAQLFGEAASWIHDEALYLPMFDLQTTLVLNPEVDGMEFTFHGQPIWTGVQK